MYDSYLIYIASFSSTLSIEATNDDFIADGVVDLSFLVFLATNETIEAG